MVPRKKHGVLKESNLDQPPLQSKSKRALDTATLILPVKLKDENMATTSNNGKFHFSQSHQMTKLTDVCDVVDVISCKMEL